MRIDRDFLIFCDHSEWFKLDPEIGYVPTDQAPREAIEAMERFNKRAKERLEQGYND